MENFEIMYFGVSLKHFLDQHFSTFFRKTSRIAGFTVLDFFEISNPQKVLEIVQKRMKSL